DRNEGTGAQVTQWHIVLLFINRFCFDPASRCENREADSRAKEELCERCVSTRNRQRQHQLHCQSAEQSLRNHRKKSEDAELPHPRSLFLQQNVNHENYRQNTDGSRNHTVPVLPEQITDHLRKNLSV